MFVRIRRKEFKTLLGLVLILVVVLGVEKGVVVLAIDRRIGSHSPLLYRSRFRYDHVAATKRGDKASSVKYIKRTRLNALLSVYRRINRHLIFWFAYIPRALDKMLQHLRRSFRRCWRLIILRALQQGPLDADRPRHYVRATGSNSIRVCDTFNCTHAECLELFYSSTLCYTGYTKQLLLLLLLLLLA